MAVRLKRSTATQFSAKQLLVNQLGVKCPLSLLAGFHPLTPTLARCRRTARAFPTAWTDAAVANFEVGLFGVNHDVLLSYDIHFMISSPVMVFFRKACVHAK